MKVYVWPPMSTVWLATGLVVAVSALCRRLGGDGGDGGDVGVGEGVGDLVGRAEGIVDRGLG